MCEAFQTDTIEQFVKEMAEKPYVRDMKDHLGRTFNNNNIYSGSSTHLSVFQGGPVLYIYIIHGKLYYAYLKNIKYLQMDYI